MPPQMESRRQPRCAAARRGAWRRCNASTRAPGCGSRRQFHPAPGLIPGAVALLLIFGAGPNFLHALFAITVLVFGTYVLWRPGETPILLFIFAFQWLQAAVSLFHANWLGVDVTLFSPFGGDNERAIALSLIGLLALALGMRAGVGAPRPEPAAIARIQAQTQPTIVWLRLYALAFGARRLPNGPPG